MGGLGSGNHNRTRGDTLETHRRIDAYRFKKEGIFTQGWVGAWQWKNASGEINLINVVGGTTAIELSYRYRRGDADWQTINQSIKLLYHDCYLGGHKVYFECPDCARRVRFLYGAGPRFLCQQCYDLVHASSREGQFDRSCRKVRKLRAKLGAETRMEAPLTRPKGMHHATYKKLYDEIVTREISAIDNIENHLNGLRSRLSDTYPSPGAFWS